MRTTIWLLLFLLCVFSVNSVFSKEIPLELATQVAKNFYYEKVQTKTECKYNDIIVEKAETVSENSTSLYYVFNYINNMGFVIVSADDNMMPILAYAFEGKFNTSDQSPALKAIMKRYADNIKSAKTKRLINVNEYWEKYKSSNNLIITKGAKSVTPLITTKWGQGCYYNALCPVDVAGSCGHAITGCVAVAACQIMKYYNFPSSGVGSNSYTCAPYGTLTADFANTTYNWGNMPDSLTSANIDVAKLLYHFGVAVEAHYTASITCAAKAELALFNHFKYSRSAIQIEKVNYTDAAWVDIIKNEIDSLRPVYYTSFSHAMVIDGYQNNYYFHINYGWNGSSDGYYYLYDLDQYETDAAVIYIKPQTNMFFSVEGDVISGVYYASSACGDYDNDGDLDILLNGLDNSGTAVMKIYRNNNGGFYYSNITLPALWSKDVDWGDYDNDGDLDILTSSNNCVYRNDNGVFNFQYVYMSVSSSAVDWGDYDNDGDLDAIISGHYSNYVDTLCIYKNNTTSFQNIAPDIIGLSSGESKWVDLDNDGDLDIFVHGRNWLAVGSSKIYINNENTFVDSYIDLLPFYDSKAVIFDYDNDKDMDIFVNGHGSNLTNHTRLYNNDNMSFSVSTQLFKPLHYSDSEFGDFDNDGDLDLILSGQSNDGGYSSSQHFTYFYENKNNKFFIRDAGIIDLQTCTVSAGDYDNDGDLDVFIAGWDSTMTAYSKIFRNNLGTNTYSSNIKPNAPTGLSSATSNGDVTLSWNKSTDDHTNQNALSYNIRIGTTPGGVDIVSPMSDVTTGFRRIQRYGNTQLNNSWTIRNLNNGTYYWSVQAIDNSFKGSSFATEQTFNITNAGINNTEIKEKIVIYPNPTLSELFILSSEINNFKLLRIYDMTGRLMLTKAVTNSSGQSININVCELTNGIYFIEIEKVNGEKLKLKFVKN